MKQCPICTKDNIQEAGTIAHHHTTCDEPRIALVRQWANQAIHNTLHQLSQVIRNAPTSHKQGRHILQRTLNNHLPTTQSRQTPPPESNPTHPVHLTYTHGLIMHSTEGKPRTHQTTNQLIYIGLLPETIHEKLAMQIKSFVKTKKTEMD